MEKRTDKTTIVALYKFVALPDFESMREPLLAVCKENEVFGTLLLAHEGINGTISGPAAGIETVLEYLKSDPRLADLEYKLSLADEPPFYRMKVKLKKEIVTIGRPEIDPTQKVGTYVEPRDWNAVIADPDVIVIDTRNDYEVGVGSFEGAINPNTFSFREFPQFVEDKLDPQKHKKVAMFCTGGIRCEKASSLMLGMGFEEVFHLHGGILKYLEEVEEDESLWHGECFVFDNRVTVDHNLQPGSYEQCFACKRPVSKEDTKHPDYRKGISCKNCIDTLTPEQLAGFEERNKQVELAEQRGERHIGTPHK